jgi:hypothetical protein
MNLFRLVRTAGILSLVAGSASSCLSPPSYPDTPSIGFESIRLQRFTLPNSSVPIDSVYITISFQDGDGDLGLTDAEAQAAPYSASYPNLNYVITDFIKNGSNSSYDSARTVLRNIPPYPSLAKARLYSTFDHLSSTTDNRKSPLKGTLTRAYGFYLGGPYLPNQELKFRISIFDRAQHQSNEVETTSVTIAPK